MQSDEVKWHFMNLKHTTQLEYMFYSESWNCFEKVLCQIPSKFQTLTLAVCFREIFTSRTCILEKNYVWQASWIASLQKCQIFLNLRFLFFFVNLCSKRHYIHSLSVLGHKHAFEWSPPVSIFILNGTEPKFKFL